MYEDEWREYYATKNESIHITRNELIFQCNEGSLCLLIKRKLKESCMHWHLNSYYWS